MRDDPKPFTLRELDGALEEMQLLMADCDEHQLQILSALYAKAYAMKLNLMAKETKHAGS